MAESLLANLERQWLDEEVNKQYKQFTKKRKVNIFIGTWNVNGKLPSEDITSWIIHDDYKPDIYVLGFQEIVDLNAANLLLENDANLGWEQQIGKTLPDNYVKIASRHLVGILLLVYVAKDIKAHCKDILINTCGVGLFGSAGNKGGVGVHMKLFDSEICFVCSHLAAHKHNVQGRNQDFAKILTTLKFSKDEQIQPDNYSSVLDILSDHDMVFWLGDLNYRLNSDNLEFVYKKIEEKDWAFLLNYDQLLIEKRAGNAFHLFHEEPINYQPTYKYQPGTNDFERRPDKKSRCPSWCDRILWRKGLRRTSEQSDVQCLKYNISNQIMSDHKPVYAFVQYQASIFDKEKQAQIRQTVMKRKDKWENQQIPQVQVEPEISFPAIKYGEPVVRQFLIANTGQVPAQFHFVSQTNEFPKWLNISPLRGVVQPNEKTQIIFEISVTSEVVASIMEKGNKLDDLVIFRIDNGADKFITVTALYLPSCFGNRLETLVKYKQPIRYVDVATEANQPTILSLPKELWRLVDYLYKYGMDAQGIFITRGISSEISDIRECLDTGKEFGRYHLHSMGEALVRFLENLQDPVFPESLCSSFKENMDVTQWCRQALMSLPLSHYNAFIYIISFLREVLKHSSRNQLTPEKLAYQFSSALMQSTISNVNDLQNHKPFSILRHFLINSES